MPIVLTNGRQPLMTEEIEVSASLPGYPQSQVNGYTYIIPMNPVKPLTRKDIISTWGMLKITTSQHPLHLLVHI